MLTTEMSKIIAAAQAGDTIVVRHAGGRPTTYKIRSIGGRKARELRLEGRRGSMRVLVDGGDQIWIREASSKASDGSAHRRVTTVDLRPTVNRARFESVLDDRWQSKDEIAAAIYGVDKVSAEQSRFISMTIDQFGWGESLWIDEVPHFRANTRSKPDLGQNPIAEMAIREAGLPPGYDIELHPRGFQPVVGSEPAGPVNASAWVAVCNAWKHWARAEPLRATLPAGYNIVRPIEDGVEVFVAAQGFRPVSTNKRRSAVDAVVDAWSNFAAERDVVSAERWACIVANSQAEGRLLLDLPRGYSIDPGDPGFFRAVFDDVGWIGAVRTSVAEAVADALIHAIERLETTLSRHRTTAIDRDVARSDASRCRRALQQIREIAKGTEPSGKELASGEMPEQVVAEVGHALRVESRDRGLGWRAIGQLAAQPAGLGLWAVAPSLEDVVAAGNTGKSQTL